MAKAQKDRSTVAQKLVELARRHFDVVIDSTGTSYAVPKEGPRQALRLQGRGSLQKQLTLIFYNQHGTTPNGQALAATMDVLEATAQYDEPVDVSVRCARTSDGLVIDLGDETGRAIVVTPEGWRVVKAPPAGVLFRRTRLTAPLPRPSHGGKLSTLRKVLSLSDEAWALVRAWLVLAWMPDVPVPILCATGVQGSGKTFLGRALVSVVDPSAAPLRSAPRDPADWQLAASASRVVGVDNISRVSPEWSDALCRAVTGEGTAKRQLYTDDELHISNFRVATLLTSIDPGAVRGDLAERLLPVELRPPRNRRTEADLNRMLAAALPSVVGGLLDLTAAVLAQPSSATPEGFRMADAAAVMAAIDAVTDGGTLAAYRKAQDSMSGLVLESDPLVPVLLRHLQAEGGRWEGTATDLLLALQSRAGHQVKQWPATARSLSARLRRLAPTLRSAHGLRVTFLRNSARRIRLVWPDCPPPASPSGARIKDYAGA